MTLSIIRMATEKVSSTGCLETLHKALPEWTWMHSKPLVQGNDEPGGQSTCAILAVAAATQAEHVASVHKTIEWSWGWHRHIEGKFLYLHQHSVSVNSVQFHPCTTRHCASRIDISRHCARHTSRSQCGVTNLSMIKNYQEMTCGYTMSPWVAQDHSLLGVGHLK